MPPSLVLTACPFQTGTTSTLFLELRTARLREFPAMGLTHGEGPSGGTLSPTEHPGPPSPCYSRVCPHIRNTCPVTAPSGLALHAPPFCCPPMSVCFLESPWDTRAFGGSTRLCGSRPPALTKYLKLFLFSLTYFSGIMWIRGPPSLKGISQFLTASGSLVFQASGKQLPAWHTGPRRPRAGIRGLLLSKGNPQAS